MKKLFLLLLIAAISFNYACNSGTSSTDADAQKTNAQETPPQDAAKAPAPNLRTKNANQEAQIAKKADLDRSKAVQAKAANAKSPINWIDIKELEGKMKEAPKKVLVDLYTDWCGWCKRMDKATFNHPDIAKYVNDNFYAVKFNAETKETLDFKGKKFDFVKQGRRGTNTLTFELAQKNRIGYPTIAFLDEELSTIQSFPGYKDASGFDPIMQYVNGDHYKKKSLAEFQKGFKSSIPPSKASPNRKARVAKGTNNNNVQRLKIDPKNIKANRVAKKQGAAATKSN